LREALLKMVQEEIGKILGDTRRKYWEHSWYFVERLMKDFG
jgi:hypothetical protein